ncbi:hypothetical protein KKA15_04880 [Patescibacteria group bacterium]|nr:hypothetical protein [Patescibacteria group bacterium]
MTTRSFSLLIFIATVLSWINFIGVLFYVDPYKSGVVGVAFFYVTLVMTLIGSLYLILNVMRKRLVKYQQSLPRLRVAWRQAVWITILMVGTLYLFHNDLLNFLNVILLIVILVVLEFFFISYKKEI